MAYRLIALDIDGTLINSRRELTEETRRTLHRAQEQGIRLVITSGRSPSGVKPLAEALELSRYGGFLIAFNGAQILTAGDDRLLHQSTLPSELLPAAFRFGREHGLHAATYDRDWYLVNQLDPYLELVQTVEHMPLQLRDFEANPVDFPVPKVLLSGDPERLAALEPVAKAYFGESANVYRSEPFLLEILPPHVDKAYALRQLLQQLSLTSQELMACGDSYNDLTMLQFAGLGVAMGNGAEEAKQAADFVTLTNDENGVAHAVEKFCL